MTLAGPLAAADEEAGRGGNVPKDSGIRAVVGGAGEVSSQQAVLAERLLLCCGRQRDGIPAHGLRKYRR